MLSNTHTRNALKSINWINALKALCIIFVFFRHSENYYEYHLGWFDGLFLPFYVNAFFFVSGYLLFWKQLSEPRILEEASEYAVGSGKALFHNTLCRIIIPSIIFSTIEIVPSCIIQGRNIEMGYVLFKTIGGGTYWFTSALAVAELVLLALFCTRKRNIWFYSIVCFTLGVLGLTIVHLGILNKGFWAWRQGLISLVFLSVGGLYWRYEEYVDLFVRRFVIPLSVLYIVLVLYGKNKCNPLISTLSIQPLGFVTSIIACLLLVWICKKLPVVKFLSFIGQNSLGFYFMSGALPITISMVAHRFEIDHHFWTMLSIWIICLIVAFVAVRIINRWLPWLWDIRVLIKHK